MSYSVVVQLDDGNVESVGTFWCEGVAMFHLGLYRDAGVMLEDEEGTQLQFIPPSRLLNLFVRRETGEGEDASASDEELYTRHVL